MKISKENYKSMLMRARKYLIERPIEENLADDSIGFLRICENSYEMQTKLKDTAEGFYIDDRTYQDLMILASYVVEEEK